eukprot:6208010-Pleurochrysis_carterae.AAC.2
MVARTRVPSRLHASASADAHMYCTCARRTSMHALGLTCSTACKRARTRAHAHTRTGTHAQAHTCTQAHRHIGTHAHSHARARSNMRACARFSKHAHVARPEVPTLVSSDSWPRLHIASELALISAHRIHQISLPLRLVEE